MKSLTIRITEVIHFVWLPIIFIPFFSISFINGRIVRYSNPDPKDYLGYESGIAQFMLIYIVFSNITGFLLLCFYAKLYKWNLLKIYLPIVLIFSLLLINLIMCYDYLGIFSWLID